MTIVPTESTVQTESTGQTEPTGQTESTGRTEYVYISDAQSTYNLDHGIDQVGSVGTSTRSTYTALMALFLISLGHRLSRWETYNLSDATRGSSDSRGSGSTPSLFSDKSGISSPESTNSDNYGLSRQAYKPGTGLESVPRTARITDIISDPITLRGVGSHLEGLGLRTRVVRIIVTIAGRCRLLLLTKSVARRWKKGQINKHSRARIGAFYAYTDTGWYMFRTWWKRFF